VGCEDLHVDLHNEQATLKTSRLPRRRAPAQIRFSQVKETMQVSILLFMIFLALLLPGCSGQPQGLGEILVLVMSLLNCAVTGGEYESMCGFYSSDFSVKVSNIEPQACTCI
jgi:hypothetical protein